MLACVLAGALSACGSENDSATTMATADPGKVTSGPPQPTGEPIKVGFLNPSLGAFAVSESGPAQEAAAKRINEQMGGINGRPLDVVVCDIDVSPEKDIACANTFAEEKVVAVVEGIDLAVGASLPTLHSAKIPLVGAAAASTESDADTNGSYYFGPSEAAVTIAPLLSFKQQGLGKVTYASGDCRPCRAYIDAAIAPTAKGLGLSYQTVYYPIANPNYQNIATTVTATHPDVAGIAGANDEGACSSLFGALRGVGFRGTISAGFCTRFIDEMGAQKAGSAQMYSSVWLPQMKQYAPPEVQKQLDMAQGDLEAAGDPSKQGYFSYAIYGTFLTLAEVMRGIHGTIDNTTVTTALKGIKDMPSFLGPPLTCDGSKWPKSSACSNEVMVASLQPDGSLKPNAKGGFLAVSPSVMGASE